MAGTFKRFFKAGIEHGVNLIKDADYREYCRLLTLYDKCPRFVERSLTAGPLKLTVPDALIAATSVCNGLSLVTADKRLLNHPAVNCTRLEDIAE
jgi:predicted nucleic acid-binding protein